MLDVEYYQRWVHRFCGQPVLVLHYPHREEFLISNLNLPSLFWSCYPLSYQLSRCIVRFLRYLAFTLYKFSFSWSLFLVIFSLLSLLAGIYEVLYASIFFWVFSIFASCLLKDFLEIQKNNKISFVNGGGKSGIHSIEICFKMQKLEINYSKTVVFVWHCYLFCCCGFLEKPENNKSVGYKSNKDQIKWLLVRWRTSLGDSLALWNLFLQAEVTNAMCSVAPTLTGTKSHAHTRMIEVGRDLWRLSSPNTTSWNKLEHIREPQQCSKCTCVNTY